ncbi:hypothetical protein Bbelb_421130 [Branchiostoma belcheri]|nr:hypothetical protein Bbelb_421130 [Branchiostoma belcheri]
MEDVKEAVSGGEREELGRVAENCMESERLTRRAARKRLSAYTIFAENLLFTVKACVAETTKVRLRVPCDDSDPRLLGEVPRSKVSDMSWRQHPPRRDLA